MHRKRGDSKLLDAILTSTMEKTQSKLLDAILASTMEKSHLITWGLLQSASLLPYFCTIDGQRRPLLVPSCQYGLGYAIVKGVAWRLQTYYT